MSINKIYPWKSVYIGPVKGVVLDWAGTAVDYGCMGPAAVFVDVFDNFGVRVTISEARQFMGLMKKDHIRNMCALPSVAGQWQQKYGKTPDEKDVDALYRETEPMMVSAISRHADLIPGLLEFVNGLHGRRIKIGSSTGYTNSMMEVLVPVACQNGYQPDSIVCSSDVPAGRPYPWMCFQNAINLETYPMEAMVKIGDTIADIEEGLNAGMWVIGISKSGNELGLTRKDAENLDPAELKMQLVAIEERFHATGAHYVAEGIWQCLPIIDEISRLLSRRK